MSQVVQRIDSLGRREAATVASGATQRVFATLATNPSAGRQAINLTNLDSAIDLWVALTPAGTGAPSISSTDLDLIVGPKSSRQLQVGPAIDVWVRSAGSTLAYSALELL